MYILRCSDGSPYIGETRDLTWWVERHNAGTARDFTRTRRPDTLVYSERFPDRAAAPNRER